MATQRRRRSPKTLAKCKGTRTGLLPPLKGQKNHTFDLLEQPQSSACDRRATHTSRRQRRRRRRHRQRARTHNKNSRRLHELGARPQARRAALDAEEQARVARQQGGHVDARHEALCVFWGWVGEWGGGLSLVVVLLAAPRVLIMMACKFACFQKRGKDGGGGECARAAATRYWWRHRRPKKN